MIVALRDLTHAQRRVRLWLLFCVLKKKRKENEKTRRRTYNRKEKGEKHNPYVCVFSVVLYNIERGKGHRDDGKFRGGDSSNSTDTTRVSSARFFEEF